MGRSKLEALIGTRPGISSRLGHFFEVSNVPAVAYIQTGLANIAVDNVTVSAGSDAGPEDTVALLALWPYALIMLRRRDLGVGAYGLFPTGSYDSDQGVFNVGENRYSAALQSCVSKEPFREPSRSGGC